MSKWRATWEKTLKRNTLSIGSEKASDLVTIRPCCAGLEDARPSDVFSSSTRGLPDPPMLEQTNGGESQLSAATSDLSVKSVLCISVTLSRWPVEIFWFARVNCKLSAGFYFNPWRILTPVCENWTVGCLWSAASLPMFCQLFLKNGRQLTSHSRRTPNPSDGCETRTL